MKTRTKPTKATKVKTARLCYPTRAVEELTRETDFKSIESELAAIDRKEQPIRHLYLMNKKDLRYHRRELEKQKFQPPLYPLPVSYSISNPRLLYLKDGFDWHRKADAYDWEKETKFIRVPNTEHENMVLKVEKITYFLMKEPEPEEKVGFLSEPFSPHVLKKEDYPRVFKGEKGSFCLVECEVTRRITLGYLTDEKFRQEKSPYRILIVPDAKKVEYFKCLRDGSLTPESYFPGLSIDGLDFLADGLFNEVFSALSNIIEKFEKEKSVAEKDIKLLNDIKCFCEFKIDAVSTFLASIVESFVNRLLTDELVNICEYCNDLFRYKEGKKYCSLLKEGKDCGKKARGERDYQKHRDRRQKYYAKEMKQTRDFLKKFKER